MIITIASIKGGAGKSSICQTLAVFLAKSTNKTVKLIDADPQKTTAEWVQERKRHKELFAIPCSEQSGAIHDELLEFDKRYDYVLVDTGGSDSKALRSSLAVSDLALVPCRPKRRDLKSIYQMADIIEMVKLHNKELKVRSLVTQSPTLPNQLPRVMDAKELLSSCNLNPLRHITCNRNAWDDSDENGCTVIEYIDMKAQNEAEAAFAELMESL